MSRFHPAFNWLDRPLTPVDTLLRARQIGLEEGLHHVYTGNLPGDEGESTYCSGCDKVVIRRLGFRIEEKNIKDGRCDSCGEPIAGVGIS